MWFFCLALPDSPLSVTIIDLQPPCALAIDTTVSFATSCMEQALESSPVMGGGVSVLNESATHISSLESKIQDRDDLKSGMKTIRSYFQISCYIIICGFLSMPSTA